MLDALGLDKRDGDGFRVLPSGDSFTFVLNYIPGAQPGVEECAGISVRSAGGTVGIHAISKAITGQLRQEFRKSGEYDAMVISNLGGLWTYLRWGTGLYNWAREQQYAWYYSDLPEAERPGREPDALFREILELEDVVKTTTDSAERDEAWRRHNLLLADPVGSLGWLRCTSRDGCKRVCMCAGGGGGGGGGGGRTGRTRCS